MIKQKCPKFDKIFDNKDMINYNIILKMDNQNSSHIRIDSGINRKITVLVSDIIKKCKIKKDRILFCKENNEIFFMIFRYVFSRWIWIDTVFFNVFYGG